MPSITFESPDLGVAIRPPRLTVYRRAAAATADGKGSWGTPTAEEMLRPVRLCWGINGRETTLELERCLGAGPGQPAAVGAAEAAGLIRAGDELSLVDEAGEVWFRGHVAQQSLLIGAQPDVERLAFVAYGPEGLLAGKSVHGQWSKTAASDDLELAGSLDAGHAVRAGTFLADLPTIFNADGRPNASQSLDAMGASLAWLLTSRGDTAGAGDPAWRGGRVFEPPGRMVDSASGPAIAAEYWTAYTALRSLVEYVDEYDVISPRMDWPAIAAMLSGVVLPEVVVEGLSLPEAMRAVLVGAGFGFCLSPWPDAAEEGGARHELFVFPLHPTSEVGLAPVLADPSAGPIAMSDDAGRAAAVQRIEILRDAHRVTNEVRVIGDRRRVQVCLEFHGDAGTRDLNPAWDSSAHDLADWAIDGVIPEMDTAAYTGSPPPDGQVFIERYGLYGHEHLANVDAFRTFVWNEDGAYRPMLDTLPDLTSRLGTSGWARRPRPLGPTLLHTAGGEQAGALPAYVQIGIVGDDDAWILLPEARVLADRAGFSVRAALLDRFYPYRGAAESLASKYATGAGRYSFATLLYNTLRGATGETDYKLRFRLVGAIAADDAVQGVGGYRTDSAWPLRATRTLYLPQRFGRTAVATGANPDGLPAATRDDSAAAGAAAESVLAASLDAMGHGSIMLRHLTRAYRPGMAFSRTRGRAVDLTVGPGSGLSGVVGVRWIFEREANKTELLLDSSLLEVTR